jgi:hypothetical protein
MKISESKQLKADYQARFGNYEIQVLQMFQAPNPQQNASGGEFPGWEPSLQMRSTPASQQVVPHTEPFRFA